MPGLGRVLGYGQYPGGPDPRQVQQARRPQEGGLDRQGKYIDIFTSSYFCCKKTIIQLDGGRLKTEPSVKFPH